MTAPWLTVFRRYIPFVLAANLAWEAAQLPLYTLGRDGTLSEQAFAVLHCTGGDVLIATACLLLALITAADDRWPSHPPIYRRVAGITLGLGVLYTIFSEWLNIVIRQSWAYSDLMPVVPVIDTGLSPLLQWIVVPLAGFWFARRTLPAAAPI
ncbi:MAG: hypothetical protein A3G73_07050 [Rhodospirillales bacterium RIFCSPLOWO2_12_FULL_67_15]|nr:MAG: hypothetical protein A3G73_07050 [Rhodospirillales bacterium RIFCSPLOWO2_12_FULL_67_15]